MTVEDGVFIGPNAILTNDRFPRAITASGELARADDWQVSPITLRTGASIGAGAVVVAGRDVGRFATVGAGAVVTRDVPDHALVAGNPARLLGWVCACGRRLEAAPGASGAGGPFRPGDLLVLRPRVRDRVGSMHQERRGGRSRDDPDLQARHRPGRGAGRPRGPPLRHARHGQAKTAEFEEAWAAYCGVRHAVLMSNGTVALEAVLHALGIGPGDEVITVSFTFNATVSAILRVGATPVFVDIREDDFCMDPALVERAVTPRTKAIMPVHLYGLMADMDPLVDIARRHGLQIVEDAAQAHGATYRGRRAGQFGPAMFSLYATKNLMTGEGGFATTDDDDVADRLRLHRNHGMRVRYHHESLGTNDKPTDLVAAIGLAQLARLDERTEQRRRNAARLTEGLRGFLVPGVPEGREHVWHQYTVRFPGRRQQIIDGLTERGIGTLVYYPIPVHRQDYLQAFVPGAAELELPVTNRLADEVLSIPVRPNLAPGELEDVIAAVRDVAASRRRRRYRVSGAAPLRVGLAGLGSMGRNHLRHLTSRPDCTLAAVGDPDSTTLAAITAQTGAIGFADPLAMIREAPLDAVVIAAPTMAHAALAQAAIERGLPVLVEKPLAATVGEGLELVAAARRGGVPLQVGHVERFNPAVVELGRRVADGWLGPLYSMTSRRAGPYPARIRDVGVTSTSRPTMPTSSAGSPASAQAACTPSSRGGSTRRTRTSCSGCCTSRPVRRACSTSTG